MNWPSELRIVAAGLAMALATASVAGEPIDNCSSLLGSLSVELRYARKLSASDRTTFVCPRDTKSLLGASKQRIINSLGPPDATAPGADGHPGAWSYYFGPRPDGFYPAGVPELRFEFDQRQAVGSVACQRTH